MRCYLHIGLQKCGSTSIQAAFDNNRESLLEAGVLYSRVLGKRSHTNLTALGLGCPSNHWIVQSTGARTSKEFEAFQGQLKERFARELDVLGADVRSVVLSQEDLSVLTARGVNRVADFLKGFFDDIVIVGYARPPAELAASWLAQEAKNGMAQDPKSYLKRYAVHLSGIAANWSSLGFKTRWRALSQVPDILFDFCDLLGVDKAVFANLKRKNESISVEMYQLLSDLNLPFRLKHDAHRNKQMYLEELPSFKKLKIGRDVAEAIQTRHAGQIERFLDIVKDIPAKYMEIDLNAYSEAVDLEWTSPPYLDELRFIIQRLNAQNWLEKSVAKINMARTFIAYRQMDNAVNQLNQAQGLLRYAAQVDMTAVNAQIEDQTRTIEELRSRTK